MAEDFGYAWRTVRLYCPAAPTFLAREWVNAAWKQLLAARRWGFLRAEITLPVDGVSRYLTMPADFASFRVLVDQARQLQLSFWHTQEDLAKCDPARTTGGPPTALIAATPSTDPLTLGRARYELFPSPSSPATLTGIINRQAARLTDTDVFTGVLADGAEVLVAGALMHAAGWPGTTDKPNPYFNATLAKAKQDEFRYGIQMLSLRDDEQYPDDLWSGYPLANCGCDSLVSSTASLRASDATLASYF